MKKHLQLLVIVLILGSFSLNSYANINRVGFKDSPIYDLKLGIDGELGSNTTAPSSNYSQLSTVNTAPIGQAGNLYTILRETAHQVAYNQEINSVLFIHRSDPALGFITSDYTYDLSTDGGATFSTVNAGPINVNSGYYESSGAARYPQTIIYNPPGNTDPNNALGVFMGATHNGYGCTGFGNDVWDGVSVGSPSLANINSSSHSNILVETYEINGCVNNALIPNSLVEGESGVFWATDWVYDGADVKELLLWKGVYSQFGNSVSWDYSIIDFPHDLSFDGVATIVSNLIDFSDDGQQGWIVISGDGGAVNCGVAPAIIPLYIRTTDGGDTWSDWSGVELQNFDGWVSANSDTLTLGFDQDLYVDSNGDPYIATGLASGGDYSISSGTSDTDTLYSVLLKYSNANSQWELIELGHVDVLRGTHPVYTDFINDQRYHISAPNDDIILVTYLDNDSIVVAADGSGSSPMRDLKGVAYRKSTNERSAIKDFTFDDPIWAGNGWFWTAAPDGIDKGDGEYAVPGVFTDWPNGDLASVFFHYVQDVIFTDGEINIPARVSVHTAAPPVVGIFNSTIANIDIEATESGAVGDICEVVFDWGDGTSTGGLPVGGTATHIYPNIDADYNVCVTVINNDGSDTYCEIVSIVAVEDTEAPIITPAGIACGGTDTISVGILYTPPGAIAFDSIDQDVTANLLVNNTVPYNTDGEVNALGTYAVEYSVSDLAQNIGLCNLTIVVVDNIDPVINLVLPNNIPLACGGLQNFIDNVEAAVASDNWDGDLTSEMTIDYSMVDDMVNGSYNAIYTVVDSSGNSTVTQRTFNVSDCDDTFIEEASFSNYIDLYPNPTRGLVNIKYDLNSSEEYSITVYNMVGELVHNAGTTALNGINEFSLDLSNQLEGIYFVRFENEEGVATKKITVSK